MNINLIRDVGQITIPVIDLLISLSVASVIGLWIVAIYRITHRGLTYDPSFLVTLVLTPGIVGVVMLLIGSNIALSLGLVGALSIIRFRTVIKDSRDMVFLFWAIAVGLGSGTLNWTVAFITSGFLAGVILLLSYLQLGKTKKRDFVFVINGEGECPVDQISEFIEENALNMTSRSFENRDGRWELVTEIALKDASIGRQNDLLEKTRELPRVQSATILSPHLSLPI